MSTQTTTPEKDNGAPFLAIAIKAQKGVVKGAKVEGMKNAAFVKTRKTLHVGMFERFEKLNRTEMKQRKAGQTVFPKTFVREVENLAEFDGPTCEDADKTFLGMLKTATRSNGVRCKADGKEAPVKMWKKLDPSQVSPVTES